MQRKTDSFGIERPTNHGRLSPMVALPDATDLTRPIRLPRPHVGAKSVIYDIADRSVLYSSEEVGRPFPRHLSARRFSSEGTNLTPPSQRHAPAVQIRKGKSMQTLQTATDSPTLIPRVVLRDQAVAQPPAEDVVGEPPLRNPSPVLLTRPTAIQTAAIQRVETESIESINESILGIHTRALYRNSSLSYQRFLFSLTKFPAIVLVLISLWTLWGRGEGLSKVKNEQNADISALVTGGFILGCQVLLLNQHYNSYKKAKAMSTLYHISMLLAFGGAVVALVFAATTFGDLKKVTVDPYKYDCKVAHQDPSNMPHRDFCLLPQQRIDYMAVVLGCSSLIIILSLATMIFGAIGQALMKKRLSQEYQRISAAKAYTNEAMQY